MQMHKWLREFRSTAAAVDDIIYMSLLNSIKNTNMIETSTIAVQGTIQVSNETTSLVREWAR